jgi:hypothetical protein
MPKAFPSRIGFAALLFLAHLVAWAADPVAFVADFRGEVAIGGSARPPFLAELAPGSRLTLGAGASASVMYVVSGEEYELKGPGEFSVAPDGVKATSGMAPTRRQSPVRASPATLVRTSRAATASLRMRGGPTPQPAPRGLQYPVEAKVATLQPVLRWIGEPGVSFLVVVSGTEGREVFRGNARGPLLRLPVKLAAGTAYTWTCSEGGRAVGEARFETLASDAIQAADRARGSAKGFSDRVALAMLLKELGAAPDAREVWIQLAGERPDIPELAVLSR